jgi:butyryl-CoA dehydrogenase
VDDSLYFNEHHIAVRDMVREFARDEVAPVAAQFDASQEFPWANIKKMGELGLLGIPWPESLGGAGFDLLSFLLVIHLMAMV